MIYHVQSEGVNGWLTHDTIEDEKAARKRYRAVLSKLSEYLGTAHVRLIDALDNVVEDSDNA